MLRDFNARVRQRDRESDLWKGTLRVHGLDERNDAGGEFLEFCSINDLTIMNSSFKEELHLGTWMYAATKRYHIIDYVVLHCCIPTNGGCAQMSKLCVDQIAGQIIVWYVPRYLPTSHNHNRRQNKISSLCCSQTAT